MRPDRQVQLLLAAYLEQWRELSKRMQAQLMPTLEAQKALRESVQKTIAPIIANHDLFRELARSIESSHLEILRIKMPDLSDLAAQMAELQNSIRMSLAPVFEQLRETFRDLPPRTQKALLLLGTHGWYLDIHMPVPYLWELERALGDGKVAEAEEALCVYFEGRLDAIESSIVASFPHRAHLISAALGAHRRGEYALSIPLLLAQTDGICKEVTDQYLFMKRDGKPRTATYVERVAADSLRAALLSPLAHTLPISASEQERPAGSDALNRHEVLHGESLDYGTRANGLKAISLLNYVANVVRGDEWENP